MNNNPLPDDDIQQIKDFRNSLIYKYVDRDNNNEKFHRLHELKLQKKTDTKEYKKLRDELILSNGGFGMKYTIKYYSQIRNKEELPDLFQEANVGLIEAVDRFDPTLGYNYTTFAFFYVVKNLIDYIKTHKLVSAPRVIARNIKHVNNAMDVLYARNNGEFDDIYKIQEYLLTEKDIDIPAVTILETISLALLSSEATDEQFIVQINENDASVTSHNEPYTVMASAIINDLRGLTKEEQDLVMMRFGIYSDRPYSLSELKYLKSITDEDIEKLKERTRILLNEVK